MAAVVKPNKDAFYVFCAECAWGAPRSGAFVRRQTAEDHADAHNMTEHQEVTD